MNRDVERILARLDRSGGPDACWEWTGYRLPKGYGQAGVGGRQWRVHRFIAKHFIGPVDGLVVRHTCDNPPCANPRHLRIGTCADNTWDMIERGRQFTKLTATQVEEIRRRSAAGETGPSLAREFGVGATTVWAIRAGRAWTKRREGD